MPFARAAARGDGEDKFDVARVDLLMTGNADRPGKPACAQGLTELGAHAVPGVGEDRPETNAGGDQAIEFGERNLRLGSRRAISAGTPARSSRASSPVQVSGRNSRRPTITGISPREPFVTPRSQLTERRSSCRYRRRHGIARSTRAAIARDRDQPPPFRPRTKRVGQACRYNGAVDISCYRPHCSTESREGGLGKAGLTGFHTILRTGEDGWIWPPENEPFPEPHKRWSANTSSDDLSTPSEFAFKEYELQLLAALAQCYRGKVGFDRLPMIPVGMAELIIRAGGLGEWMNRDEKRLKRFWDMVREQSMDGPKLKPIARRRRK
jgi:hypothetical protein